MHARPLMSAMPAAGAQSAPRIDGKFIDRKFIDDHRLLDRYLEGNLPPRGARDFETWCRNNPEYLNEMGLSERAQSSLRLLEACSRHVDLTEPRPPWWKSLYLLIGLAVLTCVSLTACWVMFGKYLNLQHRLAEARTAAVQGPLTQPASETSLTITPDLAPDLGRARIVLNRAAPQLMDVHIDLAYAKADNPASARWTARSARTITTFRIVVDKKDQGRALILNNLLQDSNNELRLTLNSTGLAVGIYTARIEGMLFGGGSLPLGWLVLDVR